MKGIPHEKEKSKALSPQQREALLGALTVMCFRLRNTLFCVHDGQWLPVDDSIEEINPVLRWSETT
jgi:hypothetical protein